MRYRGGDLVLVIDCSDLDRSAEFWAGVLGYTAEVTRVVGLGAQAGRTGPEEPR